MELKVMILDDEYIILDGLCSFPWESYGCHVAGSAQDGVEGLELAARLRPDIILSDIKMPGMDGLEFSKKIKREFPDTEIILLTGYDNFSFAQQALRIGVCEYLLKPVNFKEMQTVVGKVCDRIRLRNKQKKDYSEMRKKYQQALPIVKSKLLSDLIYGRLRDKEDMKVRMELLNIRIEQYVLVYARIQSQEKEKNDLELGLFDFVVCNICEEVLKKESIQVYSETDTLGYCFVVVYPKVFDGRDCVSHCVKACEDIQRNIKDIMQSDISFGIGLAQNDPYSMNMSYKQAVEACEQCAYMGEGASILEYTDIADIRMDMWNITDGEKRRLFSEVARGNIETAKHFAEQIFEKCEDLDVMRYAAAELLISCFQYMGSESIKRGSAAHRTPIITESIEKIYSCHTRRELLDYLKKALSFLANQKKGVNQDRNQQMAQRILSYIEGNYAEDLSLDSLSEYFKISKTYINRLLKNHAGKSFLEILLECRLVKAEQLISENTYKIYEVAEMVGYHDLSYFIRVFKKKYGVTPNVYRRI